MSANSGRANKQVVKNLVDDIRYFADIVKEDARSMMNETNGLNAYWNDAQYRSFENFMRELTDGLERGTAALYDCADKIEERELKGI